VAASAAAAVAVAPAVSQAAPTSSGPVTLGAFAAIGLILAVQPFADPANHINMVQPNQLDQIQRMLGGRLVLARPKEEAIEGAAAGGAAGQFRLEFVQQLDPSPLPTLRNSWRSKSAAQKKRELAAIEDCPTVAAAANVLGKSKKAVKRLKRTRKLQKRGPKVNTEFESAVRDMLIYTEARRINNKLMLIQMANVTYTYDTIRTAARRVQALDQFRSDAQVQKLKFAQTWVNGFLKRQLLRRRRITAEIKTLPDVSDIQQAMKGIQAKVCGQYPNGTDDDLCYSPFLKSEIWSADETAIMYGAKPKNCYIDHKQTRSSVPESDDKARFTSMLFGNGAGTMGPSFNLIKCGCQCPYDLSRAKVIDNLHKVDGFTSADGWTLHMWKRDVEVKTRRNGVKTFACARPYLQHTAGDIITVQKKAWMDSVGVHMWVELVIKKLPGRQLIIWDNCGCHCTAQVQAYMHQQGVANALLPPNMTDRLQVMDLVTNAPLKSGIRRARCEALFDYLQEWKINRLEELTKPEAERNLPPFAPPKPTLATGLTTMLNVLRTNLTTARYKAGTHTAIALAATTDAATAIAGMAKTFVKACQLPNEHGKFHTYISHETGGLLRSSDVGPQPSGDASLCESLVEVEMVPRPERMQPEDRNDEEQREVDPDSEEEAAADSDEEVY
jgi:hypothetical protein